MRVIGISGLERHLIVIDPGHGSKDPGAVDQMSVTENDTINSLEKDLNLAIAGLVGKGLEAKGQRVIHTRTGDTYPSLEERARIANDNKADIFVSIHCNSATPTARGIEVLVADTVDENTSWGKKTMALAGFVHDRLTAVPDTKDHGLKKQNVYVLRHTNMRAILVEYGFITNPREEQLLADPKYRKILADATVEGIMDYFKNP